MLIRDIFRRWGEYRQLIRELRSYSDVELAELGIVRSGCKWIAFDAAFRDQAVGKEHDASVKNTPVVDPNRILVAN